MGCAFKDFLFVAYKETKHVHLFLMSSASRKRHVGFSSKGTKHPTLPVGRLHEKEKKNFIHVMGVTSSNRKVTLQIII